MKVLIVDCSGSHNQYVALVLVLSTILTAKTDDKKVWLGHYYVTHRD